MLTNAFPHSGVNNKFGTVSLIADFLGMSSVNMSTCKLFSKLGRGQHSEGLRPRPDQGLIPQNVRNGLALL